ncbi:5'-methylthioadenosine/S-adenosylhomocysteine nucleosidase [Algicola sagamiensis]|uniref:5'-methylthioadenosine/S-adenosylhomocysteine nucleosidase n=1 Tax=Algicola sagamiensis TaxID=163869 RepID=UPI00037357E4|nr:5'-methylthioadenosine/S-adenosylhomocysteine nucleosidase [Algicola sagamiensis]
MKIGIIGAMEPEVAILKDKMVNRETIKISDFEFFTGEIDGEEVVLVQSGIGKVASSVATTLMIMTFSPACVINTGSAGGFDPALHVGDIVIGDAVKHHDVDVTAFGYEMGQVPKMPAAFTAHKTLITAAEKAAQSLQGLQIKTGLIATGDSFMCDPERIEKTRGHFPDMLAVEMEGASIAQSAHMLQTPFLIIRSLSDIAGKESPDSFEAYLEKASINSSELVLNFIKEMKDKVL